MQKSYFHTGPGYNSGNTDILMTLSRKHFFSALLISVSNSDASIKYIVIGESVESKYASFIITVFTVLVFLYAGAL